MATIINITDKIKNEEKFIAYNGKTYKVDDSKNTIMRVYALLGKDGGSATVESIDAILKELIGKDAVKDFSNFTYEDYLVPFFAAMACVQGKTYEEVERSFRES